MMTEQQRLTLLRRRLLREIKHFQDRINATTPGTCYHTRARNCCRLRIKKLLAVDRNGHPARWDGITVPAGAENQDYQ